MISYYVHSLSTPTHIWKRADYQICDRCGQSCRPWRVLLCDKGEFVCISCLPTLPTVKIPVDSAFRK